MDEVQLEIIEGLAERTVEDMDLDTLLSFATEQLITIYKTNPNKFKRDWDSYYA